MDDLLRLAVEEDASDVHLSVGAPPTLRIRGQLTKLDVPPLTPEDTEQLARGITSEANWRRVVEEGTVDFGFPFKDKNRFRVSVYRQKGFFGSVLRLIPKTLKTLKEIGLPPVVGDLLTLPRGLVLVTGPTGSGKTTTLASMLNVILETSRAHIITIEDPIEYYHEHKRGIVNQREVGVDVPSFAEGLRRALRQDPDVILVGEMRDLETMETAITAAETGHLVFATLHTTGAARTVDRIIDAFPAGPAGADPHAALVESQGGDLAVAAAAHGRQRAHRGVRDHDQHAVDRRADPRQQDLPHPQRHPDRIEVRHDDARSFARGFVFARASSATRKS